MRRLELVVPLLATLCLASTTACKDSSTGGEGAETGETLVVASDVAIAKVSINQGVQVTLNLNGEDLSTLNTGLVANRNAMVRVFVATLPGFENRGLEAILTIASDDDEEAEPKTYTAKATIDGISNDADLSSTFNFEVPGEDLPTGVQNMSVTIYEIDDEDRGGDTSRSVWPENGEPFEAFFIDVGPMRITMVPIQYDADGSGRLPDISAAQIQIYEDLMTGMFPVPEVQITIADPFPWGGVVNGAGQGWQELLMAMVNLRSGLGLEYDEYIYGLFNAADTFEGFCGGGCIAGLSLLSPEPGDSNARSSIGIGFPGIGSAEVLAHEVGHAHGREHAPCGILGQPTDPGYPYAEAQLGVWGWDGVTGTFYNPSTYTDIMSYCKPAWLSDYTYDNLLARSIAVNVPTMGDAQPPVREWSTTWVDDEGNATTVVTTQSLSVADNAGELHPARFLDAAGVELGQAQAHFYPTDHLAGGLLIWPVAPVEARSVAIDGFARLTL